MGSLDPAAGIVRPPLLAGWEAEPVPDVVFVLLTAALFALLSLAVRAVEKL